MGIHDIRFRVEGHVPHLFQQGSAADHPLGVEQEELQQPELPRGEVQRPAAPLHHPTEPVHFQVLEAEDSGDGTELTAGEGVHPGEQLLQREGLGQVVVRTSVETADHILGGIP